MKVYDYFVHPSSASNCSYFLFVLKSGHNCATTILMLSLSSTCTAETMSSGEVSSSAATAVSSSKLWTSDVDQGAELEDVASDASASTLKSSQPQSSSSSYASPFKIPSSGSKINELMTSPILNSG